jgi:Mg2+/citrate symporter
VSKVEQFITDHITRIFSVFLVIIPVVVGLMTRSIFNGILTMTIFGFILFIVVAIMAGRERKRLESEKAVNQQ